MNLCWLKIEKMCGLYDVRNWKTILEMTEIDGMVKFEHKCNPIRLEI
jgi:hypothetical protein